MSDLVRAEETGIAILDAVSKFHLSRAKIVTKVIKYRQVADYTRGLAEMDEKAFVNIRLRMQDLRNSYTLLYDLLFKNMDKILNPRSHNTATMY